jgi:hypothetical protein
MPSPPQVATTAVENCNEQLHAFPTRVDLNSTSGKPEDLAKMGFDEVIEYSEKVLLFLHGFCIGEASTFDSANRIGSRTRR